MKLLLENWRKHKKYLKDHPYMEPDGLQEEQKEIKKVVSFDFDNTLALSQWDDNLDEFVYVGTHKEMLAKLKKYGYDRSYTVYVITSRHGNKEERIPEEHPNGKAVQEYLDEQGIIVDGVYFTNGQLKKEKLIELEVDIHHDDDPEEVRAAEEADVEVVVSDPYGDYKRLQKTLNEEEPFQKAVKKNYRKMKIRLVGKGGNKYVSAGMKKPSYARSKSAPPGFGGSLEEGEGK